MNKTILAVLITGFAGSAMATGYDFNAVVNSSAAVSVGSTSISNITGSGVDFSMHSAGAAAWNTTGVSGSANAGNLVGYGKTEAHTAGGTFTWAAGIGEGAAGAFANQVGVGSVNVADKNGGKFGGKIENMSAVGVNTISFAEVTDSGLAGSGSYGKAHNETFSGYLNTLWGVGSSAVATGEGVSLTKNWGVATPGDVVTGAGIATQTGDAFAKGRRSASW